MEKHKEQRSPSLKEIAKKVTEIIKNDSLFAEDFFLDHFNKNVNYLGDGVWQVREKEMCIIDLEEEIKRNITHLKRSELDDILFSIDVSEPRHKTALSPF